MTITLKYSGTCAKCQTRLPKGARANWTGRGKVECEKCSPATEQRTEPRADYIDVDRLYEDECARRCGY